MTCPLFSSKNLTEVYLFGRILWLHCLRTHKKTRLFCPLYFPPNRQLFPIFSTDTCHVPIRVSLLEETECNYLNGSTLPWLVLDKRGKHQCPVDSLCKGQSSQIMISLVAKSTCSKKLIRVRFMHIFCKLWACKSRFVLLQVCQESNDF